jgi:hypothetical protein
VPNGTEAVDRSLPCIMPFGRSASFLAHESIAQLFLTIADIREYRGQIEVELRGETLANAPYVGDDRIFPGHINTP